MHEVARAATVVRKKMGQMPTRWSCAFTLGSEGCSSVSARITALHASCFNINDQGHATPFQTTQRTALDKRICYGFLDYAKTNGQLEQREIK